ncbi:glutathionylspermidine synthase family protein [Klebsiella pneumoniae]|nr:glutathionylspermidine synthase family protein [Klebsiella pneumoniae]
MLWSLFPHHRYLLDTDFEVNDELAKTGYAVKPISGRCGNNIDLIDPQDELLDKTSGRFVDRKNIYQQLKCLPKVDVVSTFRCARFTVGGNYGGTCLRGDSVAGGEKRERYRAVNRFERQSMTYETRVAAPPLSGWQRTEKDSPGMVSAAEEHLQQSQDN